MSRIKLKDLKPGTLFDCGGIKGILLSCNINAEVLITETPNTEHYLSHESYYRGRKLWSAGTEVVKLGKR